MHRVVQFSIPCFKPECSQGNNRDGKRQAFSVSVEEQERQNKAYKCLSGLLRWRFTYG